MPSNQDPFSTMPDELLVKILFYLERDALLLIAACLNTRFQKLAMYVDSCRFNMRIRCDGYTRLHEAVYKEDCYQIDSLLTNGADVDVCTNEWLTPLHMAAARDRTDVMALLLTANAKINVPLRADDATPLHTAVLYKNFNTASLLLDWGADVNAEYRDSFHFQTPLLIAVENGDCEMASLLWEWGASINRNDMLPLSIAIKNKDPDMVEWLITQGEEIDPYDIRRIRDIRDIISKITIPNKQTTIINAFLDAGLDVNTRIKNRATLLHIAVQNKNIDIINRLLKTKNIHLDVQMKRGNTPLHLAVKNRCLDIVKLLLEAGADSTVKNRRGVTPLDLVHATNNEEMMLAIQNQQMNAKKIYYSKTSMTIFHHANDCAIEQQEDMGVSDAIRVARC